MGQHKMDPQSHVRRASGRVSLCLSPRVGPNPSPLRDVWGSRRASNLVWFTALLLYFALNEGFEQIGVSEESPVDAMASFL